MAADSSENERTYIIDSENSTEMARLINQDQLLTKCMGGLFAERAQDLSNIHRILDIGCGPGAWVLDVAHAYPKVRVVGVDISQQMIEYANAHAWAQGMDNASFKVMNALDGLDFPEGSFDLVNARFINGFMIKAAWPKLMQDCLRILRPGGTLRLTEGEWGLTNAPACEKMGELLTRTAVMTGRSFSPDGRHIGITPMLRRFLSDAGFTNIGYQGHAIDYSSGSEDYGSTYQDLMVGLKLLVPFLVKAGMTTEEEFEQLYQQALIEMMSEDFCAIGFFLTAWGEKP